MASVINTNVMSLNSQRNLSSSQTNLATSIQRLSSGLRINSAKDDAAGLAISERFTAQIRGLDVATRNANDAISLAQTAEGAMVEISNNLQRIRELAVQSSNATNSESDRAAMQAEVTQLTAEIDRVATQTNFNGHKLLDGSFKDQGFQIGANKGETISVSKILNAKITALGGDQDGAATTTNKTFTSTAIETVATEAGSAGGKFVHSAIAAHDLSIKVGDDAAVTVSVTLAKGTTDADSEAAAETAGAKAYGDAVAAAINNDTTLKTKIKATADADGNVSITGLDNDNPLSALTVTGAKGGAFTDAAAGGDGANAKNIGEVSISTFEGAQKAIEIADEALKQVNSARAEMGAVQNRFSSTIANLSTTSENLSASRSRIQDTDYAQETASLTRAQILQQAGTAMLAQANSSTQSVLSLLR